jgi:hypothetical protein
MNNSRHSWFSLLMLLASAAVSWGQPSTAQPAIAAAKKRQQALKTVEFVFSRTDVDMPAMLGPPAPAGKSKKPIPEKETVVESKGNRLILDGARGRLEDHHPMWNENTGELGQFTTTSTTQGTSAKTHIGQVGADD